MPYDRDAHRRRSIRLPRWDYREQGAYFVTVCTSARALLFEDAGLRAIAEDVWRDVAVGNDRMQDEFVVMPNHVHGIIWIPGPNAVGAQQPGHPLKMSRSEPCRDEDADLPVAAPLRGLDWGRRVESGSLAAIVRSFKAATAKRVNNRRGTPGAAVWQRNYYERVIRDEGELELIRGYILDNPRRWAEDEYNPLRNSLDG